MTAPASLSLASLLVSAALAPTALAQIQQPGVPASARTTLPSAVPLRVYAATGTRDRRAARGSRGPGRRAAALRGRAPREGRARERRALGHGAGDRRARVAA